MTPDPPVMVNAPVDAVYPKFWLSVEVGIFVNPTYPFASDTSILVVPDIDGDVPPVARDGTSSVPEGVMASILVDPEVDV